MAARVFCDEILRVQLDVDCMSILPVTGAVETAATLLLQDPWKSPGPNSPRRCTLRQSIGRPFTIRVSFDKFMRDRAPMRFRM